MPVFVITDSKGLVRFLSNGSKGWLHSDSNGDMLAQALMERIVAHDDDERTANDERTAAATRATPDKQKPQ